MSWLKLAAEEEDPKAKQMAMGRKVEKEHTETLRWLIRELGSDGPARPVEQLVEEAIGRIAEDHLRELPDYYTRLARMEEDKGAKAPPAVA
jgi:hypothetical protein